MLDHFTIPQGDESGGIKIMVYKKGLDARDVKQ
jgi:hypothetical protein